VNIESTEQAGRRTATVKKKETDSICFSVPLFRECLSAARLFMLHAHVLCYARVLLRMPKYMRCAQRAAAPARRQQEEGSPLFKRG